MKGTPNGRIVVIPNGASYVRTPELNECEMKRYELQLIEINNSTSLTEFNSTYLTLDQNTGELAVTVYNQNYTFKISACIESLSICAVSQFLYLEVKELDVSSLPFKVPKVD